MIHLILKSDLNSQCGEFEMWFICMISGIWYLMCDISYVRDDIWYMIYDRMNSWTVFECELVATGRFSCQSSSFSIYSLIFLSSDPCHMLSYSVWSHLILSDFMMQQKGQNHIRLFSQQQFVEGNYRSIRFLGNLMGVIPFTNIARSSNNYNVMIEDKPFRELSHFSWKSHCCKLSWDFPKTESWHNLSWLWCKLNLPTICIQIDSVKLKSNNSLHCNCTSHCNEIQNR
jgi:hypothetical protein